MSASSDTIEPARVLSFPSGHTLYVGSRHHAKDRSTLRRLGIRHILNVTPSRDVDPTAGCPNYHKTSGGGGGSGSGSGGGGGGGGGGKDFTYLRCAVFDNSSADLSSHFAPCCSFISRGQHYSSILVHCNRGQSRSVSVICAYLMQANGMRLERALAHVRKTRPQAQPNPSFLAQLEAFDAAQAGARGPARGSSAAQRGPARGPVMAAQRIGPSIGPALPPRQQSDDAPAAAAVPIGPSIGPTMPPQEEAKASIGPIMPPPPAPETRDLPAGTVARGESQAMPGSEAAGAAGGGGGGAAAASMGVEEADDDDDDNAPPVAKKQRVSSACNPYDYHDYHDKE